MKSTLVTAAAILGAVCGARELLSQVPAAPAQFTVAPLTSHGLVGRSDLAPAVSPDGRHVAYIRFDRPGPDVRSEIWILDRQTMREEVLIPQAHVEYWGIDFAPDGRAVYAAQSLPPFNEATLIRVRLSDRRVETVRANAGREPAISPDGRSVAFNRRMDDPPGRELIVAPLDGGDERVVARRKRPEALNYPIWRADGGAIHFRTLDAGHATILVEVTLADGAERVIAKPEGWANASPAAWLPDGHAFVLTANQGSEVWRVSYPDGALQRLGFTRPALLNGLDGAAAEPVIVGVTTTSAHRLWTARPDGAGAGLERPWPYPFSQPIWTADEKLLFVRRGATGTEFVVAEPGGQEIRVHALGVPAARFPKRSRDGQVLVWSSDAVGDRRFWRTGPGGESPATLTTGPSDFFGSDVSPDGTWIAYTTWATGRFAVWKMELSGGSPSRLIGEESMLPAISPDGQWVAAYYRPSPAGPERIVIVPAAGGEPVSLGELPIADGGLNWTPDGGAVSFPCAPNRIPNICVVPRGGGRAKQITAFTEGDVVSHDWSPTGQLLVVRGLTKADLVRIDLR